LDFLELAQSGGSEQNSVSIALKPRCEGTFFKLWSGGARARVSLNLPLHAKEHRPSLKPIQSEQRKLSAYGSRTSALKLPVTPEIKPREINFLYGAIADEDFPRLTWRKLYNQALMKRQSSLYYAAPEGAAELRSELQGYLLRARGLSCSQEQIIIVQGAQQAIDLCARLLVDPGSEVLMEEPCYLGARLNFEGSILSPRIQ
jgi:GntR family transcriptional regulator / MocR family aminotransferase